MISPAVTGPLTQSRVSPANTAAGAKLEQEPAKSFSNGSSTQAGVNQSLINKEVTSALPPRTENLAFSLRLLDSDSAELAHHVPATSQPTAAQTQPNNQTQGQTQGQTQAQTKTDVRTATPAATAPPVATATRAAAPAATPAEAAAGTANPTWSETAATQHVDLRTDIPLAEPQAPVNPSTVAAMHDAQPVLPETARPNTTGEILLQLGGKDQPAAIRVTDRAGAINVSVHATDPELRSSLRSNLGELASQLSHQGWKTDVIKSGTTLTRAETSQQDSRQDGQRSSSQQQSSAQGERQPQRDRRAASDQWLAELEEQASGNSGNPGGTN